MGRAWLVLALIPACTVGSVSTDRQAYLQALESGDVHDCDPIADASLRGECRSFAARALMEAQGYESARAVCEATQHEVWRQECFYLIIDPWGTTPAQTAEACARTGSFADQCAHHAVRFQLLELMEGSSVGQELELIQQARDLVRAWHPLAAQEQIHLAADLVVARAIAGQVGSQSFDPALCGQAPEPVCHEAYRQTLRFTPRAADVPAVCEGPLDAERLAGLGVRPWLGDQPPVEVWEELCSHWVPGRGFVYTGSDMGDQLLELPPVREVWEGGPLPDRRKWDGMETSPWPRLRE